MAVVQHVAVLEQEHEFDHLIAKIDISKLVDINKTFTYDDVGIEIMNYALRLCVEELHTNKIKTSRINSGSLKNFISSGFENDAFTHMLAWNGKMSNIVSKPDAVFLLEWTDTEFSAQKAHIYYEADADGSKNKQEQQLKHSMKIYQSICGCRRINEEVPAVIVRSNLFRGPEMFAEHTDEYIQKIRNIVKSHLKGDTNDDDYEDKHGAKVKEQIEDNAVFEDKKGVVVTEEDDTEAAKLVTDKEQHAAIPGLLTHKEVRGVVSGTKIERAITFLHLLCVSHVWTCWSITQLVQKKGHLRDMAYVACIPRDLYFFVGAFTVPPASNLDSGKTRTTTTLRHFNVKRGMPVQVVTIQRYEGVDRLVQAILTKDELNPTLAPNGIVTIQDLWNIAARLKSTGKAWTDVIEATGKIEFPENDRWQDKTQMSQPTLGVGGSGVPLDVHDDLTTQTFSGTHVPKKYSGSDWSQSLLNKEFFAKLASPSAKKDSNKSKEYQVFLDLCYLYHQSFMGSILKFVQAIHWRLSTGNSRIYVNDMKYLKMKSREVSDSLMSRAGAAKLHTLGMHNELGYRQTSTCLGQLCMTSLCSTLPILDPGLKTYIATFNCANIELFLRIIRCSNTMAFEELAHSITRSSLQEQYKNILKILPLGSASEFEYIMRYTITNGVQIHTTNLKPLVIEPLQIEGGVDEHDTFLLALLDIDSWADEPLHYKVRMCRPLILKLFHSLVPDKNLPDDQKSKNVRFSLLRHAIKYMKQTNTVYYTEYPLKDAIINLVIGDNVSEPVCNCYETGDFASSSEPQQDTTQNLQNCSWIQLTWPTRDQNIVTSVHKMEKHVTDARTLLERQKQKDKRKEDDEDDKHEKQKDKRKEDDKHDQEDEEDYEKQKDKRKEDDEDSEHDESDSDNTEGTPSLTEPVQDTIEEDMPLKFRRWFFEDHLVRPHMSSSLENYMIQEQGVSTATTKEIVMPKLTLYFAQSFASVASAKKDIDNVDLEWTHIKSKLTNRNNQEIDLQFIRARELLDKITKAWEPYTPELEIFYDADDEIHESEDVYNLSWDHDNIKEIKLIVDRTKADTTDISEALSIIRAFCTKSCNIYYVPNTKMFPRHKTTTTKQEKNMFLWMLQDDIQKNRTSLTVMPPKMITCVNAIQKRRHAREQYFGSPPTADQKEIELSPDNCRRIWQWKRLLIKSIFASALNGIMHVITGKYNQKKLKMKTKNGDRIVKRDAHYNFVYAGARESLRTSGQPLLDFFGSHEATEPHKTIPYYLRSRNKYLKGETGTITMHTPQTSVNLSECYFGNNDRVKYLTEKVNRIEMWLKNETHKNPFYTHCPSTDKAQYYEKHIVIHILQTLDVSSDLLQILQEREYDNKSWFQTTNNIEYVETKYTDQNTKI